MTPQIKAFFDPRTSTATYLVWDPDSRHAVVIDPVLDLDNASGRLWTQSADAVLAETEALGLTLDWVLDTHAHADHLSAAHYIKGRTGAPVAIGEHITEVQHIFAPVFAAADVAADGSVFDRLLKDGDEITAGALRIRIMHTPGHTPACLTYLIGGNAFVGDTLFQPDYGTARADFPGGDAHTLYRSIRRLLALPADTVIWVGHDYPGGAGRSAPEFHATVAEQRAANRQAHEGVDEDTFVAMRQARDAALGAPALLLPSLQVNIRGGRLPPADPDGRVRLKLPLTLAPGIV